MATTRTAPVATGSKPEFRVGSSARIEMKVEAHSAAPVPDGGHEQPADPRGAGGSPGAREMAHADPGSEQAR
jgi:hypothetical protein